MCIALAVPAVNCWATITRPLTRTYRILLFEAELLRLRTVTKIRRELSMTTPGPPQRRHVSHKASLFTESVIREMTCKALKHGPVNLSHGFPDFAAPEDINNSTLNAAAAA